MNTSKRKLRFITLQFLFSLCIFDRAFGELNCAELFKRTPVTKARTGIAPAPNPKKFSLFGFIKGRGRIEKSISSFVRAKLEGIVIKELNNLVAVSQKRQKLQIDELQRNGAIVISQPSSSVPSYVEAFKQMTSTSPASKEILTRIQEAINNDLQMFAQSSDSVIIRSLNLKSAADIITVKEILAEYRLDMPTLALLTESIASSYALSKDSGQVAKQIRGNMLGAFGYEKMDLWTATIQKLFIYGAGSVGLHFFGAPDLGNFVLYAAPFANEGFLGGVLPSAIALGVNSYHGARNLLLRFRSNHRLKVSLQKRTQLISMYSAEYSQNVLTGKVVPELNEIKVQLKRTMDVFLDVRSWLEFEQAFLEISAIQSVVSARMTFLALDQPHYLTSTTHLLQAIKDARDKGVVYTLSAADKKAIEAEIQNIETSITEFNSHVSTMALLSDFYDSLKKDVNLEHLSPEDISLISSFLNQELILYNITTANILATNSLLTASFQEKINRMRNVLRVSGLLENAQLFQSHLSVSE